jgi:hypothetical protein
MARFRTWLLAGFAVLASTVPALAQSGTLSGRVTSSDGARPIGGAAVTVASASGVEVARVTAGGDGRYRVPGLNAGTYRVNVAAIGHEPRVFASVQVQAGGNTLDAVLEPGVARLEEITVVSAERSQVPEKATQAPASVFALTRPRLRSGRSSASPITSTRFPGWTSLRAGWSSPTSWPADSTISSPARC